MTKPPFEKPQRFYTWHRKAYWTYWTRYSRFNNPWFTTNPWHRWEDWAVFIGFKPEGSRWFDFESYNYDGMTYQLVVLAGICFGRTYGYDAAPVEEA